MSVRPASRMTEPPAAGASNRAAAPISPRPRTGRGAGRVRQALRHHGLDRAGAVAEPAAYGAALRQTLASLGPPFDRFGRFLAARLDRLPADAALDLTKLAVEPMPWHEVQDHLDRSVGAAWRHAIPVIEPTPVAVGGKVQRHRGRDRDGRPVELRIALPRPTPRSLAELAPLDRVVPLHTPPRPISRSVREDFAAWVSAAEPAQPDTERPDLGTDAATAEHDTVTWVAAPTFDAVCGPGVQTLRLDGLDAYRPHHRHDATRAWLRAWLAGHPTPFGGDLAIRTLPSQRSQVVVLGGRWHRLDDERARIAAWSYLRAIADHDPAAACAAAFPALIAGDARAIERYQGGARQLVPFRDGGWTEGRDSVAEYLILHVRLAARLGLVTTPAFSRLWQGAYWLATSGGSPYDDCLGESLTDLAWEAATDDLRATFRGPEATARLIHAVGALAHLPRDIDHLLERAAKSVPANGAPPRRKPWSGMTLALLGGAFVGLATWNAGLAPLVASAALLITVLALVAATKVAP